MVDVNASGSPHILKLWLPVSKGMLPVKQFGIFLHIGRLARMSVLDTKVDGWNPGSSMLFP